MSVPALYTKHLGLVGIAEEYRFPGAEREDVRQEARIALWQACRAYDKQKGPFPAFARTVIHRHLTSCLRAATRRKQRVLTDATRQQPELPAGSKFIQDLELVVAAAATLPPAQRAALKAHLNGRHLSSRERSSLYKARKKLKAAAA